MQIDWITVSAQIVNFLILVWLLKRFLYGPVVRAMDRREERIGQRLEEARDRETEAEQRAESYEERRRELDERRDELLEEARDEAADEKKRLLDEARTEVDEARGQWLRQLERERDAFADDLRRDIAAVFRKVADKALAELADRSLEEQMVARFVDRLEALDEETLETLGSAEDGLRVTSAAALEPNVRSRMTRALHEHVAADAEVTYDQSDELLCGIVLHGGGLRIGWSLADSLEGYDEQVRDLLADAGAATAGAKG
jgi:F-type H+-transporting ATPase subunit b